MLEIVFKSDRIVSIPYVFERVEYLELLLCKLLDIKESWPAGKGNNFVKW